MAITRKLSNGLEVVDLTKEINEVDNQYGFVKSLNLFNTIGTSQKSIIFDKSVNNITLLPQVNRSSREKTYGKDRNVETFALPLAYFKHGDLITPDDIQGFRMPGETGMAETLNRVRFQKLTDMRLAADMTDEYLQIQALKGVMKSPDGAVVADMFGEFGVSQITINFDLSNANSDIDGHISDLKDAMSKNLKAGAAMGRPMVMVDRAFFSDFVAHPKVREAYIQYQNAGSQQMRDDLTNYFAWGVTETFFHRGVMFVSYNPEFDLPGGGTETAFESGEGIAIVQGVNNLYRGFYGPANKLTLANQIGQQMFVFEYPDPKDECHELDLEMAPLYFNSKPLTSIKVVASV